MHTDTHDTGHVRTEAPLPAIGVATLHRRQDGYVLVYPPLGSLYMTDRWFRAAGEARIPSEMALGVRLGWEQRPCPKNLPIRRYRVALRGDTLTFRQMED